VQWASGHAPRGWFQGNATKRAPQKSKDLSWRNIHFRKNAYLFRKFQAIFLQKTLYPGHHLVLSLLPFNVNQRSKELRWLVTVGVFSQKECLVKNTIVVSCVKIQMARPPCPLCRCSWWSCMGCFLLFIVLSFTSQLAWRNSSCGNGSFLYGFLLFHRIFIVHVSLFVFSFYICNCILYICNCFAIVYFSFRLALCICVDARPMLLTLKKMGRTQIHTSINCFAL